MRQGPHKNRSRSRGRRPTTNQSGRVYESNGPDVKVRGTAQTVADKYLQLARDALSAGDPVMAEGYFQHAEHYLRILATSQPYAPQGVPQRRPGDDYYEDGEDGEDDQPATLASGGNGEAQRHPQHQPQTHQPQTHQPQTHQQQHQPQQPHQQPHAHQPAAAPAANETAAEPLVEQPWGGPEPEFLRRSPTNGAVRSRRQRQPRGGNGRNEPATGQDGRNEGAAGGENAGSQDNPGQDNPGQDTTEQT